jgi:catechol-2,3-dioxygenase
VARSPIQLDPLILKVNDLAESVAFYRDLLGPAAPSTASIRIATY